MKAMRCGKYFVWRVVGLIWILMERYVKCHCTFSILWKDKGLKSFKVVAWLGSDVSRVDG